MGRAGHETENIQRASAKDDENRMLEERADLDDRVSRNECLAEQEAWNTEEKKSLIKALQDASI